MASGPKAPSTTTQTNKVELSPEQKQIFQLAFPSMKDYASSNISLFPGSGIANFNPLETAAQSGAIASGAQGQQLANAAAASQNFLLSPDQLNPDTNPFLKAQGDAIAQSTTRNLMESILPGIRSGTQITGGQYSGGQTKEGIATGLAVGRTSDAIASNLAKLYGDAYSNGLKTMTTAQANNPTTMQSLLFGPSVEGQVGSQLRSMDQAKLDEQMNRYMLEQQLPLMKAQDLIGMINGMPGATGVSTVTGAQPKATGLMAGLGGAATGAGLASTLFPAMAGAGPVGAGLGLLASLLMR